MTPFECETRKLLFPMPDYVRRGEAWARDVIEGKILQCKWVRLACERHFKDLERDDGKYYFDWWEVDRRCKFIEKMPHTKGKWARKQLTIQLEDWQIFKTMCLFGWKRVRDGHRRFKSAFILEPRKNAKSTWAACVGLSCFVQDNEHGAEVYSGATTEKQAWEVFKPARLMALGAKKFKEHFKLTVMKSNISRVSDGAKFEPLVGNPGDGSSPSCAIIDEYHEHDTDRMVDTMETGMGAREQPLLLIITTAGDNLAGPAYAYQKTCEKVLEGVLDDDEVFVMIFTIDKDVDWTTEEALRMANPNVDVSVDMEFLKTQQKRARQDSRRQGIFKTKHLNQWVMSRDAYFNTQRFMECEQPGMHISQFKDQPCVIGLDLASKHDIVAKEIVFKLSECNCVVASELQKRGFIYARFGKYYLPSETVELTDNSHYEGWAIDGHLTITEGEVVDYIQIEDDIDEDIRQFQVKDVAYDEHQARTMIAKLMAKGVECTAIPMTVLHMSEPMKELDALIRQRSIAQDGNPVYTWMLSCVTAKLDNKDNVYPTKDKNQPQNKIDGPIATIMCLNRWMEAEEGESVYESHGLRTI